MNGEWQGGVVGTGRFDEDKVGNDRLHGCEKCAEKGEKESKGCKVVISVGTNMRRLGGMDRSDKR